MKEFHVRQDLGINLHLWSNFRKELLQRLKKEIDAKDLSNDSQYSFRIGRSTIDASWRVQDIASDINKGFLYVGAGRCKKYV